MIKLRDFVSDLNVTKEELSYAALSTIVSHAGGACQKTDRIADNMGIDVHCDFDLFNSDNDSTLRYVEFGVQLKSTSKNTTVFRNNREYWSWSCKTEQTIKYSANRNCPFFIMLFVFPDESEYDEWCCVDTNRIKLKKSLYWIPTKGITIPENNTSSVQLYFPKENLLTPESLIKKIVLPIARREDLHYEGL